MDHVVQVERLPAPGETTQGWDVETIPGGKGANQANAAARLSPRGRIRMVGLVGFDDSGEHLKASLASAGVDIAYIGTDATHSTGIAMIWVEARTGQNSIVVAAEANGRVTPQVIESLAPAYDGAKYALFQLETPLDAVEAAMRRARVNGASVILDPAPARVLPASLLALVDILTPNESEACILLERPVTRVTRDDAPALARALLEKGPRAVILKLGDQGCYYSDGATALFSDGFAVKALDTTAAGDTFNGALAVALFEGQPITDALRFANAAAAISVTRFGAQVSAPSRAEVEAILANK